ncbi:MAG TPA: asparaginase [Gaiellaceae bacterium]|nr:asparaginase [Gaiellaceae bacterium]
MTRSEPILVAERRGGTVESLHRVHAVAVRDGEVVASAGDPQLVTFFRSSAKPLQALLLARARPDLDDRVIAIACASHRAEPAQIDAVRDLLAAAPATQDDLELGLQEGRPPERIYHNCSGKHAGMLAVCRARGWPTERYRLPDHPLQQEILAEVTAAADATPATGTDHCSVVSFALPLERMATALSRLRELDGGERIATAMRAHPALIGGEGSLDTELMQSTPGWLAKGGAEGLLCGVAPDGAGFALKVEDGGFRALGPAFASFFAPFFPGFEEFARVPVENSRGEIVGEVSCL